MSECGWLRWIDGDTVVGVGGTIKFKGTFDFRWEGGVRSVMGDVSAILGLLRLDVLQQMVKV